MMREQRRLYCKFVSFGRYVVASQGLYLRFSSQDFALSLCNGAFNIAQTCQTRRVCSVPRAAVMSLHESSRIEVDTRIGSALLPRH
jgi:hypothetical protein